MKKLIPFPGLFVLVLSLAASVHAGPSFVDEEGKHLSVLDADGVPVLRYEYAHEIGEDGKVSFDTSCQRNGEPFNRSSMPYFDANGQRVSSKNTACNSSNHISNMQYAYAEPC